MYDGPTTIIPDPLQNGHTSARLSLPLPHVRYNNKGQRRALHLSPSRRPVKVPWMLAELANACSRNKKKQLGRRGGGLLERLGGLRVQEYSSLGLIVRMGVRGAINISSIMT